MQSPHKISVNAFISGKPFFVFTFGFHVTRSQNSPLGYNRVKPVFAADRLSSFAHFDFLASLRRQLRNGTERNWKKKSNYYHSTPTKQYFMFVLGTKTLILRAT